MLGLSGTRSLGRSGTGLSDYREPESPANPRKCWAPGALNNANKESNGFLLTPQDLCADGAARPPRAHQKLATDPPLTHVTLFWREGSHEDWLRFGRPVCERIIDRRQRIESYAPGQVFALVRWASNDYGTRRSTLDIVRAVGRGEMLTRLPGINPGGELLLSARSWHRVRKVLGLIDAIEETGIDPCDVSPEHWRHMHNRLAVGMTPRAYNAKHHRAWLRRRTFRS
ncbi:MAG: DUF2840 domain-containing protein [Erythrobacter sp.]|nr:DUF2840 domain-containing protein [Erythrobacter sp.]